MKKIVSVASATVMMLCLGGIYSWSVISKELIKLYQLPSWQTQMVYGLVIFTFTFMMIFTGRLIKYGGPRLNAVISGILLFASYYLTSLYGSSFIPLLIFFGLMGGAAIGFGYVAALSIGVSAIPKYKGLVSGIIVAGYGAGAIILTNILEAFLQSGMEILPIMQIIGWIYGPVVILAALLMFKPEKVASNEPLEEKVPLRRMVRQSGFWALSAGILFGTLPGLILIGKIKDLGIVSGHSEIMAAQAIIFLSIGSMLGRIVWGSLNDHFKQKRVALFSLASIVLSIGLLAILTPWVVGFWIAAFFLGFTYGGCLSIYPAQTASLYGAHHVNEVYPFILFAHGVAAATGPPAAGALIDSTGSYMPVYLLSAIAAAFGFAVYFIFARSPHLHIRGKEKG